MLTEWTVAHPQCRVQVIDRGAVDLSEKVVTMTAGGAAPVATMAPAGNVTAWAARKLIDPVDDLFKRDKLTGSDFHPPVWEMMSWQKKVWLMPMMVDANFPFFWNKAALREVGINPDRPPATVEELDRAGQQMNRVNNGQVERLAFAPWDWYGLNNSFLTASCMFGARFHDAATDKMAFNHPQAVKALEWMSGWAQRLNWRQVMQQFQVPTGNPWLRPLAEGTLAFHPMVTQSVPQVRAANQNVQLGYGPLPASAPGIPGAVWVGAWSVAAAPGTNRREDAWELMRFIGASPEGTLAVATHIGGLPAYTKSPGLDYLAKDPDMVAHVDAVKRARFLRPEFHAPMSISYAPLNDVLDGKRAAREVLDEINVQAQRQLDEFRATQPR